MQWLEFLQNAALANQALDDMDAVLGLAIDVKRVPVAELARTMTKGSTYNHIRIANSQVGVLNTGDLAKIDAAITIASGSDVEAIARQLQALTQAIVNEQTLDEERRRELIELVQVLSDQVVRDRKPSVVRALLRSIQERTGDVVALAHIVDGLSTAIGQIFGS